MKSYLKMNYPVTTLGVNYLVHTGYLYTISRLKVSTVASYRYYFTSKSDPQSSDLPPVPIFTINNLNNEDCIKSSRIILKDKGGNTDYFSLQRRFNHTDANKISNNLLNSNYITGFSDAESTFGISVVKSKTHKIGLTVTMIFSMGLHIKDLDLLTNIRDFFLF